MGITTRKKNAYSYFIPIYDTVRKKIHLFNIQIKNIFSFCCVFPYDTLSLPSVSLEEDSVVFGPLSQDSDNVFNLRVS